MRQRDLYRKALEEIESNTVSHSLTDEPRRIAQTALIEAMPRTSPGSPGTAAQAAEGRRGTRDTN